MVLLEKHVGKRVHIQFKNKSEWDECLLLEILPYGVCIGQQKPKITTRFLPWHAFEAIHLHEESTNR